MYRIAFYECGKVTYLNGRNYDEMLSIFDSIDLLFYDRVELLASGIVIMSRSINI